MGKKILLILFLGFSSFICAQEWIVPKPEPVYPAHEFRFGIGVKPFESARAWDNMTDFGLDWFDEDIIHFDVKDYYEGTRFTTNALFGEYTYQANKWIGIGFTAVYFSYFSNYYDAQTDIISGSNVVTHVSLYPTLRYTWLNKPNFSMYSSFGMGLRFVHESDRLRSTFTQTERSGIAAQFTLFGFTIGRNIYVFSDFSTLGTQGTLTAGIGYRLKRER